MPNPVLRVLLAISVLIAALSMAGVGAGIANADPDAPADPSAGDAALGAPTASEPQPATELPMGLPTGLPTTRAPSIFDIPLTIATQLRDMFGRPLSVVGNGRVPGLTDEEATTAVATTGRKRDKPAATEERKPDVTPPEPFARPAEPVRKSTSSVEIALPFVPPISVPVPSIQVPGYENVRWSLNLTDPYAAFTSVAQTLNTVNSLLADAYAPHAPTPPPSPAEPGPTLRTSGEEPSVVEADGTGAATPLSSGSDLPILQAPVVVPQIRVAAPRPIRGTVSSEAQAKVPVQVQPRVTVAPPGPTPAEQPPPNVPPVAMGNPVLREGYPRYLRSARSNQIATVALPGLAGLIVITASGGVIGYRQANSGRYLRSDAARYLQ